MLIPESVSWPEFLTIQPFVQEGWTCSNEAMEELPGSTGSGVVRLGRVGLCLNP